MKKVSLICLDQDREKTLSALRDLGVVHLTHIKEPEGHDLHKAESDLEEATNALHILQPYAAKTRHVEISQAQCFDASEIAVRVNALAKHKRHCTERLNALLEERASIEPYGDFDPEQIKRLKANGVFVKLYHVLGKEMPQAPEDSEIFLINNDTSGHYVVLVSKNNAKLDAREFSPPSRALSAIQKEINNVQAEMKEIESELESLASCIHKLSALMPELQSEAEFIEARCGMGAQGKLAYLQGFCPQDKISDLHATAKENGIALAIRDPSDDDEVPTLVRYPAWVRAMRPVFAFLGITPGYKETDISPAFFIFLSIFFAMIVGDAGYGLFFLMLLPYFRHKKFSDANPEPFRLLYVFSISTVIWGILIGNYFGIDYSLLPGFLQKLRVDWLIGQGNSMTLSLLLGAIHLTLAHAWKAVRFGRNMASVTQAGWICIIWTVFMLARHLLVGTAIPLFFLIPLATLGGTAIIVGLSAKKEWMNLGLLALDLVSCFGDIMSYLRLFALGIASAKVAEAFNGMAGDLAAGLIGFASTPVANYLLAVAATLGMALVLIVGHGLNIILCAMSVLVHGVRLNALEFSLHMGQEWSGFEYKPFACRLPANPG